jgi:hypothetical protein
MTKAPNKSDPPESGAEDERRMRQDARDGSAELLKRLRAEHPERDPNNGGNG